MMESEKIVTLMKGGGSTPHWYDPLVQKIGMLTINWTEILETDNAAPSLDTRITILRIVTLETAVKNSLDQGVGP